MRRLTRALREIFYWRSKLRLLKDWNIEFDTESEYKDMCGIGSGAATIYDCSDSKMPEDYIFHEMLHIAWAVVRKSKPYTKQRENEEILVQDLSKITFENLGKFVSI